MRIEVGVDIGGTFTDIVFHDASTGEIRVAKVPSTPADLSDGLISGLEAVQAEPVEIDLLVHGTTVSTNAVLERSGARCGLIMTTGFRDVIELRRRDRPQTYGLKGHFKPLVSRECRVEVEERTDYAGNVLVKPTEAEIKRVTEELLSKGVEAVIISFLNSYANPSNEEFAKSTVEKYWPNPYVVASSEVLPEIREFERTSTAVLSGYVMPLVDRYLETLTGKLRDLGYERDLLVVQSNGGLMSQQVARRYAVNTILSGPAAGVIAAQQVGAAVGSENLITCDVGGTSLDIALAVGGRPATAQDVDLDYGLPIRTTMLDVRSVGAGGGSIAWIDRAGFLQIGPRSAGADPGPVCYRQGGVDPTVTDANVVLGRIGMSNPIGREAGWQFDKTGAERAIEKRIANPLGIAMVEAAWAILQVANDRIAAAIRLLTVERGHDPRDFALVAYGGAGPLHACAVVRELEVSKALIPVWPGITSALGCLTADVRHDFSQSLNARLDDVDSDQIYDLLEKHSERGRRLIDEEAVDVSAVDVIYQADMSYEGQVHQVRVNLPANRCGNERLIRAFEDSYSAQYGNVVKDRPVRLVTLRAAVIGRRRSTAGARGLEPAVDVSRPAIVGHRQAYFDDRFEECPIYERERLKPGLVIAGPAIIAQSDATTVIEPGMVASVHATGVLIVEAAK